MKSGPRIGLVRHGATDWTQQGRYQGRADVPLSAQGLREVEALTEYTDDQNITRIVTSPLCRARQTAERLAGHLGLSGLEIDDDLLELDYGAWEGLTQAELKLAWPEQLRAWKTAPADFTFPDGESLLVAQRRVKTCLARWQKISDSGPMLLVTHSAWIRLALLDLAGESLAHFKTIHIPTGSLVWLDDLGRQNIQPNFIGATVSCAWS